MVFWRPHLTNIYKLLQVCKFFIKKITFKNTRLVIRSRSPCLRWLSQRKTILKSNPHLKYPHNQLWSLTDNSLLSVQINPISTNIYLWLNKRLFSKHNTTSHWFYENTAKLLLLTARDHQLQLKKNLMVWLFFCRKVTQSMATRLTSSCLIHLTWVSDRRVNVYKNLNAEFPRCYWTMVNV